jgi:hypothetical protein
MMECYMRFNTKRLTGAVLAVALGLGLSGCVYAGPGYGYDSAYYGGPAYYPAPGPAYYGPPVYGGVWIGGGRGWGHRGWR